MDRDTIQSYIAILIGVVCILGIIALSDEICWGEEYTLHTDNKRVPTYLKPSPWICKQAIDQVLIDEAEKEKNFYEKTLDIISEYTEYEFKLSDSSDMRWKLNKLRYRHGMGAWGNFTVDGKVKLDGEFTTFANYTISW